MASLLEQLNALREQGKTNMQAANKPSLLGVRPSDSTYSNAPGQNLQAIGNAAQAFVENRRQALRPPTALPQPSAVPPQPPTAPQPGSQQPTPSLVSSPPSLPAAQNPNDNSISTLGDYSQARDINSRSQTAQGVVNNPGRSLIDVAASGQQPAPIFAGDSQQTGITVAGKPTYNTGYYDAAGRQVANVSGINPRQGGGTLSFVPGGPGAEQQAATAQTVAGINSQIDALRSLRESANPGITTGYAGSTGGATTRIDPFARAGDGRGDSQLRQQQYDSFLKQAANGRGLTKGQRSALVESANTLIAPGLGAAKLQNEQQASADSLAGQLAQAGARQSSANSAAQQQALEAAKRLGLDTQRLGLDQAALGLKQQEAQQSGLLNAAKVFESMGKSEQQQAKNELFKQIQNTREPAELDRLTKLYELINRDQQPVDPFALYAQRQNAG